MDKLFEIYDIQTSVDAWNEYSRLWYLSVNWILIEYRLEIIKYYWLTVEEPMDYPLLILVVLFI